MKPPTKFELMRANRHIAEARGRGFPLSRNPIDALICEAQLQEQATAVPTMEIDGVRYREAPEIDACDGCALHGTTNCSVIDINTLRLSSDVFGGYCGERDSIYIRAE